MGSDCNSLHQERSPTMRWHCLAFLLLITVAGVQLLEDDTAESALNKLRESEGKQPLADVLLPLVKRETQRKKPSRKMGKISRKDGKKKTKKRFGKKSRKGGKKKKKSNKNGRKDKKKGKRKCKKGNC